MTARPKHPLRHPLPVAAAFLAVILAGLLLSWPDRQPPAGTSAPIAVAAAQPAVASRAPEEPAPLDLASIPPAPAAPPDLRLDGPVVDPVILEPDRRLPPDAPVAGAPAPTPAEPAWQRNAVAWTAAPGQPRIAIVIDDVGVAHGAALTAIALPAPLTLAFLPYAEGLPALTAQARKAGHELLIHMPMEPRDLAHNNPGPEALLTSLPPEEIRRRLEWALGRFDGYVGINNHMGSAFSTDVAGLSVVMRVLHEQGLLFLDSRTIGGSKAEGIALDFGVPAAARDVFLDNVDEADAIRAQLAELERIARKRGSAIAIGHPHAKTLAVLQEWLPEARERGFALVPLSALVTVPPDETSAITAKGSARDEPR